MATRTSDPKKPARKTSASAQARRAGAAPASAYRAGRLDEEFLTTVLNVARIGICLTDEHGYFVEVNPAFCELFGYKAGRADARAARFASSTRRAPMNTSLNPLNWRSCWQPSSGGSLPPATNEKIRMHKVLIIDDEAQLRANIARRLKAEGHPVIEADYGAAGEDIACKEMPDLIICNITMPELDGFGTLFSLRENATTSQIPFIFLTASTKTYDRKWGLELGANDFLTKPFPLNERLGT